MQNDFDPRKRALVEALGGDENLPGGMPGTPGNPNTGIGGPPVLSDVAAPAPALDVAPAAPAAPVSDYGRLQGYSADKLNDPNKHDFKYDTARVMSQFDPKQGFTPELIAALNQLNYGTFSGGGDKLSLSGAKNARDAADFNNQDWIYAHKAQNDDTKWQFGGGGAAPEAAPPGGGLFSGSTISPMLQGNAQNNIQNALENIGGLAGESRLQELIKALGGSPV